MKHITVSFFTNALQRNGTISTDEQVIELIKGNGLQTVTTQYRMLDAGHEKDDYKKKSFPAVTWSGTFKTRKADQVLIPSGLICMDIDKLEPKEHDTLKKLLSLDDHTFFLFTSPGGAGLKWVIKIEPDATKHLDYFKAIETYAKQEYGVSVDPSGKDISRLCFLCYDANCYSNRDSIIFNIEPYLAAVDQPVKKLTSQQSQNLIKNTGDQANDVFEFTQAMYSYSEGSRNDFVFHYALNCARKGIDQIDCENFAAGFASDLKPIEVTATIRSAYKNVNNANEFGKYAKKIKPAANTGNSGTSNKPAGKLFIQDKPGNGPQDGNNTGAGGKGNNTTQSQKDYIQFWKTNLNPKTGTETLGISYNGLTNFLEDKGFFLFTSCR